MTAFGHDGTYVIDIYESFKNHTPPNYMILTGRPALPSKLAELEQCSSKNGTCALISIHLQAPACPSPCPVNHPFPVPVSPFPTGTGTLEVTVGPLNKATAL